MVAPAALWQTRAVFRERLSLTDQGCLDQLAQAPSTTSTPTVTPIPLPAVLKPTVGPGPTCEHRARGRKGSAQF